jgi:hypothetical protein
MKTYNQDSLNKALGLFIDAFRHYVVATLYNHYKDNWVSEYYNQLSDQQKHFWDEGVRAGSSPETLIDYHNLYVFALGFKPLFRNDFGKSTNKLKTWLDDISEVRNKTAHYQDLDDIKAEQAFNNMILIAQALKMSELEEAVKDLKESNTKDKSPKPAEEKRAEYNSSSLMPWFQNVRPHFDIRQGNLDESVFAANLAEVALGRGREIYQNHANFFEKTYFTSGLKTVAKRVIKGLNGEEDAENRVISLQTGFGGGKTHTLISLYHIAKLGSKIANSEFSKALVKETGLPKFEKANIAVFTNTTNDPTQGRNVEGLNIKTVWGELAYQLGGIEAYNIIKANDEARTAPKGLFKQVLERNKPALILIDELADYCVAASGIAVGASSLADQTISFLQELSEAVSGTNNCVMVATLPASEAEVANSAQAAQILTSLSNRLTRVGSDTKPVADEEIFEVIRHRLFENLGNESQIENTINAYSTLYNELWTELPSAAPKIEYKEKLRKSYPFHPELIDMFRIRWASNHDFQRTRGVLRLLASIVSDLWKRQNNLVGVNALIHTSDLDFNNLDALSGQLKKLYGNGYDAVITADIAGTSSNAFKIDDNKPEYGHHKIACGIASTILLGSFGATSSNKGISIKEIKLCTLKPNAYNHNSVNGALDLMEGHAHYLYHTSAGVSDKRYWFHTKPNINILINQAKNEIKEPELNTEILKRINIKTNSITLFNVLVAPSEDIPEQQKPTLVILGPEHYANPETVNGKTKPYIKKLATKKGNSDRIYRNTMLFLVCSEIGISKLRKDVSEYLACEKIKNEYHGQLEAEQKDEIKKKIEDFSKQVSASLVSAYSIVVKYSAADGIDKLIIKNFRDSLDIQINSNLQELLKTEEWLLESVGLGTLRNNNLYPLNEKPIKVKDIYEAFLRFDDKPMITNVTAIQDSLQRYCVNGEFVIASGEPDDFTKMFYKEPVPFFDVTDSTYWLVDKNQYKTAEQPTKKVNEPDITAQPTDTESTQPTPIGNDEEGDIKNLNSITISGKVDLANYQQIFSSFIMPLKDNQVEIEIKIKGTSNSGFPITENSTQYKITKESASQLGLDFEVE